MAHPKKNEVRGDLIALVLGIAVAQLFVIALAYLQSIGAIR